MRVCQRHNLASGNNELLNKPEHLLNRENYHNGDEMLSMLHQDFLQTNSSRENVQSTATAGDDIYFPRKTPSSK